MKPEVQFIVSHNCTLYDTELHLSHHEFKVHYHHLVVVFQIVTVSLPDVIACSSSLLFSGCGLWFEISWITVIWYAFKGGSSGANDNTVGYRNTHCSKDYTMLLLPCSVWATYKIFTVLDTLTHNAMLLYNRIQYWVASHGMTTSLHLLIMWEFSFYKALLL